MPSFTLTPVDETPAEQPLKFTLTPLEEPAVPDSSDRKFTLEPVQKTFRTALSEVAQQPSQLLPFVGSVEDIAHSLKVKGAADAVNAGTDIESDRQLLADFNRDREIPQTLGYRVGKILAQLPSFAGELALTSGIYSGGRAATTKLVESALGKAAETAAGKLAARVVSKTAASGLQTLAAGPLRATETAIQFATPQVQTETNDKGDITATVSKQGMTWQEAIPKGVLDQFVETFTEHTGENITGALGAVARKLELDKIPVPNKVAALGAMAKEWLTVNPDSTVGDMLTKLRDKTAWSGWLGEMGEERLGEIMKPLLGVQDSYQLYGGGTLDEMAQNAAAEAIAFGVPGAAAKVAEKVVQRVIPEKPDAEQEQRRERIRQAMEGADLERAIRFVPNTPPDGGAGATINLTPVSSSSVVQPTVTPNDVTVDATAGAGLDSAIRYVPHFQGPPAPSVSPVVSTPVSKQPALPKVGDIVEQQVGFPPRALRGIVTGFQNNPVPGAEPVVPLIQVGNGTPQPAIDWFYNGKVVPNEIPPTSQQQGAASDQTGKPPETPPPPSASSQSPVQGAVAQKFIYRSPNRPVMSISQSLPKGADGWTRIDDRTFSVPKPLSQELIDGLELESVESVAESLNKAEKTTSDRDTLYREAAAKLPEGAFIGKWRKQTIGGDVFWVKRKNKKQSFTISNILPEVGRKAINDALIANGLPPAEVLTPRETQRKEQPDDLIGHLIGQRVRISLRSARELREDYRPPSAARILFVTDGGRSVDDVLQSLHSEGQYLRIENDDDLLDAIDATAKGRVAAKKQGTVEKKILSEQEQQTKDWTKEALRPEQGKEGINVSDLVQGDKFTVAGETVTVKELHFDPDTTELTYVELEDGKRFGVQTVGENQVIYPDKGSVDRVTPLNDPWAEPPDKKPEPPPSSGLRGNQAELNTGAEDFKLVGEKATDQEKLAAAKAQAEKDKAEAAEIERKKQLDMFAPNQAKEPIVLWGKKGDVSWIRLTENISNAEVKRRESEGWTVLRYPRDTNPGDVEISPTSEEQKPGEPKPNTIITDERADELRKRIKGKIRNIGAGVDPTIFTDAVQLGAYYIEKGFHRFEAWSAKMLEDFGDAISEQLRSIYETARITIESPSGESRRGQPPGLQPGLRPPADRIVTARAEFTKAADESILPPELVQHLDPHQRQWAAAAITSLEDRGGFLSADGTGAGKTRQALAVAHYYAQRGQRVVIVTKAETIKPNWKTNVFGGSYGYDSKQMGVKVKLDRDGAVKPGEIGVTTYENLGQVANHTDGNTVLIFDEAHALKNDSQRARHGTNAAAKAKSVVFMSATPADKAVHIYYLARMGIMEGKTVQQALRDLGMTLVTVNKMVNEGGRFVKKQVTFWAEDQNVTDKDRHDRFNALFNRMTSNGAMIKREISMDGVHVQVLKIALPPKAHETMASILRFFDADHIDDLSGLKKAIVLGHQRRQQEPFKIASTVMLAQRELAAGRQVVIFVSRVNASEVGKWVKVGNVMFGGEQERVREVLMSSEGTAKTMREALEDAGIHDIAEIHGNADQESLSAMADFQAGKKRVVIATIESGGPQPYSAKVLTPAGWRLMGDLAVGDLVIAGDGTPTTIRRIFEQGVQPVFQLKTATGATTRCTADHLWLVNGYGGADGAKWTAHSLSYLMKQKVSNYRLPVNGVVEFSEREVAIEPYLLGLLLGDGSFRKTSPSFCNMSRAVIADVEHMAEAIGVKFNFKKEGSLYSGHFAAPFAGVGARKITKKGWVIEKVSGDEWKHVGLPSEGDEPCGFRNPLTTKIRAEGLWDVIGKDKFIPEDYLFNSVDVRLGVLRGLMDTDGTVGTKGDGVIFCNTSKRLADGLAFLVRSLGGVATVNLRPRPKRPKASPCYYVSVGLSVCPFKMAEKVNRWNLQPHKRMKNNIHSITPDGEERCRCLLLDHPSHLYITDDFIVTHNTGINLDDIVGNAPRTMIMVTAPFDAVGNVQAAGRIWRLKTLSGSNLFYLFGDTDVDDWNADIIGSKMATLGAVVEGQVRRLDVSNPDSVTTDDYHEKVKEAAPEERGAPTLFPQLDWKPFKTKAGKDKFVAPVTAAFTAWFNANGKFDNKFRLRPSRWNGKEQVWSDTAIPGEQPPMQSRVSPNLDINLEPGFDPAVVDKVVADWKAKHPKAPSIRIVDDPTDILTIDGIDYVVRGAWDGRLMTVNRRFITSEEGLIATLNEEYFHSLIGTKEGQAVLRELWRRNVGTAGAHELAAAYTPRAGEGSLAYDMRLMNEWLAKLPETNPTLWQRIVEAVKAFINKHITQRGPFAMTDEDIGRYLRRRLEQRASPAVVEMVGEFDSQSGTVRITPPEGRVGRPSLVAHHGTPHEVDQFSTAKIGSGEGAQVYGWGLYFAENPKVAEEYRNNLSKDEYTVDGKKVEVYPGGALHEALYRSGRVGNEEAERYAGEQLRAAHQRESLDDIRYWGNVEKELIKLRDKEVRNVGASVYTVEINAEPDDLLDWDKPLEEQSAKVKAAIQKSGAAPELMAKMHGDQIYRELMGGMFASDFDYLKGAARERTERLVALGIKGVRYLDQGSRHITPEFDKGINKWIVQAGGEEWRFDTREEAKAKQRELGQTSNYVIFNDADIKITHKNGQRADIGEAVPMHMLTPVKDMPGYKKRMDDGNIRPEEAKERAEGAYVANHAVVGSIADKVAALPAAVRSKLHFLTSRAEVAKQAQEEGGIEEFESGTPIRKQIEAITADPIRRQQLWMDALGGIMDLNELDRPALEARLGEVMGTLSTLWRQRKGMSQEEMRGRIARETAESLLDNAKDKLTVQRKTEKEQDAIDRITQEIADIGSVTTDQLSEVMQHLASNMSLEQLRRMSDTDITQLFEREGARLGSVSGPLAATALNAMRLYDNLGQELITLKLASDPKFRSAIIADENDFGAKVESGKPVDITKLAERYHRQASKADEAERVVTAFNKKLGKVIEEAQALNAAHEFLVNDVINSEMFQQNWQDASKEVGVSSILHEKSGDRIAERFWNPNDPEAEPLEIRLTFDQKDVAPYVNRLKTVLGWYDAYKGGKPQVIEANRRNRNFIENFLLNARFFPQVGKLMHGGSILRGEENLFDALTLQSRFGVPEYLGQLVGGKLAAQMMSSLHAYSESRAAGIGKLDADGLGLMNKVVDAAKRHGMTTQEWRDNVSDPILASYQSPASPRKIEGDLLLGGIRISATDMAVVRAQQKWITELIQGALNLGIPSTKYSPIQIRDSVGSEQFTRNAMPSGPLTVPKTPKGRYLTLAEEWNKLVREVKNGTEEAEAAHDQKIVMLENSMRNVLLSHLSKQRDVDYRAMSVNRLAYMRVADAAESGDVPINFEDVVSRVSHITGQSTEDVEKELVKEFDQVMKNFSDDHSPEGERLDAPKGNSLSAENFMNNPRGAAGAPDGMYAFSVADDGAMMNMVEQSSAVYGLRFSHDLDAVHNALTQKLDQYTNDADNVGVAAVRKSSREEQRLGETLVSYAEAKSLKTNIEQLQAQFAQFYKKRGQGYDTDVYMGVRQAIRLPVATLLNSPPVVARNFAGVLVKLDTLDQMISQGNKLFGVTVPMIFASPAKMAGNTLLLGRSMVKMAVGVLASKAMRTTAGQSAVADAALRHLNSNQSDWGTVAGFVWDQIQSAAQYYDRAAKLDLFTKDPVFDRLKAYKNLPLSAGRIINDDATAGRKLVRGIETLIGVGLEIPGVFKLTRWVDIAANALGMEKADSLHEWLKINALRLVETRKEVGLDKSITLLTPQEILGRRFATAKEADEVASWFTKLGLNLDKLMLDYAEAVRLARAKGEDASKIEMLDGEQLGALSEVIANLINRGTFENRPTILKLGPLAQVLGTLKGYGLWENTVLARAAAKHTKDKNPVNIKGAMLIAQILLMTAVAAYVFVRPAIKWIYEWWYNAERQMPEIQADNTPYENVSAVIANTMAMAPVVGNLFTYVIDTTPSGGRGMSLLPLSLFQSMQNTITRAVQTGDVVQPAMEFVRQYFPTSQVLLNRLESQEGLVNYRSANRILRAIAPTDMEIRQNTGTTRQTPLTPELNAIVNAITAPGGADLATAMKLRQQVIDEKQAASPTTPIKDIQSSVDSSILARLPVNSVFGRKVTDSEMQRLRGRMNDSQLRRINEVDAGFAAYANEVGRKSEPIKQPKQEPVTRGVTRRRSLRRPRLGARRRTLGRRRLSLGRSTVFRGMQARRRSLFGGVKI